MALIEDVAKLATSLAMNGIGIVPLEAAFGAIDIDLARLTIVWSSRTKSEKSMIIVTTEVSFPRKTRTVFANPSHNYTHALLASIPRMPNGPGLAPSSSTERACKAVQWFLIDPGNSDRCSANSLLRTRMLITRAVVENSISSRGPSPSHGFESLSATPPAMLAGTMSEHPLRASKTSDIRTAC